MAKLFYADDFFYTRVSMFPYKEYQHIGGMKESDIDESLKIFDENSFLREAILIASPSLYYALLTRPLKNPQQEVKKLIFFLMRMLSRSTPYGMFAFVGYGSWGKEANLTFDMRQVKKHTRLDMEWLYLLLTESYSDLKSLQNLTVYANPLLQEAVGKIYLEFRLHESDNKVAEDRAKEILSIKKNKLIEKIILFSEKPVSVLILVEALKKHFSTVDEIRLVKLIQKLILNQILVSTNLPLLTYRDSIDEFITDHVSQKKEYEKYATLIKDYDLVSLGTGEARLEEVYKVLRQRINKKNLVQVDLVSSEGKIILNESVKRELTESVELLWILTQLTSSYQGLDKYHVSFLEKYGKGRLVPLKELTNTMKGLGHFLQPGYLYSQNNHKTTLMESWENFLTLAVDESIASQFKPIELDKKEIDKILRNDESFFKDKCKALNSFDVFFKIKASNQEELNKGAYTLFIFETTQQAYASVQRFMPHFEKNIVDKVKSRLSEEALLEDTACCGISFWPNKIRNANVVIHPQTREHILNFQKGPNYEGYTLDDVYIASDGDRFYACTSDGKEFNICFDTLLNLDYAPLEVKFLHRIRLKKYLSTYAFNFPESFKTRTFLPRIVYNKTILHKARWRFCNVSFISMPSQEVAREFNLWLRKWHVPVIVEVGPPENPLLLNLDNPSHFNQIVRWLRNGEELFFSERFESDLLKSNSESFCSEFVAPFIKNKVFSQEKRITEFLPFIKIPLERERLFFFEKTWFFIKCYIPYEHMNSFLIEKVGPFLTEIEQKFNIKEAFFIRYYDVRPHIRLRIKINKDVSFDSLFQFFKVFFNECIKSNYLHDINISTYEREIVRYGGLKNIEYVENIFCADSNFIIDTMSAYHSFDKNKRIIAFTASAYFLLSHLMFNKEDMLLFARGIIASKVNDKKYDENIKEISRIIIKTKVPDVADSMCEYFLKSAEKFYHPLRLYINYLSKSLDKERLFGVFYSLLHMHCNRLGCNVHEEKVIVSHLRHLILKLNYGRAIGVDRVDRKSLLCLPNVLS